MRKTRPARPAVQPLATIKLAEVRGGADVRISARLITVVIKDTGIFN